jgi:DNA-binding PadR family transcriptional regulator
MSAIRFFVLGSLARNGPMHGHEIRKRAQQDRTELWANVSPGSLYGAIKRMAKDGVIEEERTEQEGRLPTRTIYAITDKGRMELSAHRDAVLEDVRLRTDPMDLALVYSDGLSRDQLRARIEERRRSLAGQVAEWQQRGAEAAAHLVGLEPVVFAHMLMRLEAELAWHDLVMEELK